LGSDYINHISERDIETIIRHVLLVHSMQEMSIDSLSIMTQNIQEEKRTLQWVDIQQIFSKHNLKVYRRETDLTSAIESSSSINPYYCYSKKWGWIAITGERGVWIKVLLIENKGKAIFTRKSTLKEVTEDNSDWIYAEPVDTFSGGLPKDSNPSPLERIFNLIRMESSDIKLLTIYSLTIVVLSLVVPVGTQSLINILSFGAMYQPIFVLTVFVTVLLGLAGFLKVLQTEVAEILQQRLFVRLVSETKDRLLRVKNDILEKKNIEEIVNYFLDISIIQKSATVLLIDGLSVIIEFFVGVLVLLIYHPLFLVLDIALFISIFFIIFRILGRRGSETSIAESKAKHKIVNWFEELASNSKIFKSSTMHHYASERTELLSRIYIESRNSHYKVLIKQIAALTTVKALGMGFVLGIGSYLVIQGELSLGQLIAAEIIVSKILSSFSNFGKHLESYFDLVASIDKVGSLLNIPIESSGDVSFENSSKGIHLKFNKFEAQDSYGKKIFIPNLEIKRGTKIGIHSSDPDKCDLFMKSIYGLASEINGSLLINGKYSIQELNLPIWRDSIAYLSDDHLFSGNIYENIKSGRADIDQEKTREALEKVGTLNTLLENFQNGILTQITSSGFPIRKNDLFRINLAKSIGLTPDLLLIDRIFNTLQREEKDLLKSIIHSEFKDTTVIIISQHKEFINICDKVIEI
jgi:putative ABC transport system ATP-binding protein